MLLPFFQYIYETKKKSPINFIPIILNFELGDVTIVADDEEIKAHKCVLRFATFFRYISGTNIHQQIFIHLILNFEIGDVTIVADDERIKAHIYILRFAATFLSIHL